ncbi:desumoylating isopeptidase 1 [Trichonephila clavipes]|nr:desumoylating isopeptidase 1 [Trichonephila clavipes]
MLTSKKKLADVCGEVVLMPPMPKLGETILGEPDQILTLGKTELPYSVFLEYIFALGESTYRPGSYHLLEHNCNCFSQEVCQFLTGGPIPEEIRELPQEISGNK